MRNKAKDELIEKLRASEANLRKALEMIRDDDKNDDHHPCDPPTYGYFGTLAGLALRDNPPIKPSS